MRRGHGEPAMTGQGSCLVTGILEGALWLLAGEGMWRGAESPRPGGGAWGGPRGGAEPLGEGPWWGRGPAGLGADLGLLGRAGWPHCWVAGEVTVDRSAEKEMIGMSSSKRRWAARDPHLESSPTPIWLEKDPERASRLLLCRAHAPHSAGSCGYRVSQARGHAQPPASLWRSPTRSPARVPGHCLPAGRATSWGPSLENVPHPTSSSRPGSLSTHPCRPGPPQDPVVQDNANDRDGGAQRRESGKTPWRRWCLHGVEEEQKPRPLPCSHCVWVCAHTGTYTHTHSHTCMLTQARTRVM